MKHRSAEALARRASRRGRTVEEQKALDRGKLRGVAPANGVKKKRRRGPDGEGATAQLPAPPATEAQPSLPQPPALSQDESRRAKRPGDPSKAWANSVVSAERIEENRRLRECYASAPESLRPEERERAAALVARDERKRAKKAERQKGRGARQERNRTTHANRRLERQKRAEERDIKKRR